MAEDAGCHGSSGPAHGHCPGFSDGANIAGATVQSLGRVQAVIAVSGNTGSKGNARPCPSVYRKLQYRRSLLEIWDSWRGEPPAAVMVSCAVAAAVRGGAEPGSRPGASAGGNQDSSAQAINRQMAEWIPAPLGCFSARTTGLCPMEQTAISGRYKWLFKEI